MIDWARVTELREEIGDEDFSEVVELFLEEVDAVIATLAPGMADLEAQLHFLKGRELYLGIDEYTTLCQDGSQPCRHQRCRPPHPSGHHVRPCRPT